MNPFSSIPHKIVIQNTAYAPKSLSQKRQKLEQIKKIQDSRIPTKKQKYFRQARHFTAD